MYSSDNIITVYARDITTIIEYIDINCSLHVVYWMHWSNPNTMVDINALTA